MSINGVGAQGDPCNATIFSSILRLSVLYSASNPVLPTKCNILHNGINTPPLYSGGPDFESRPRRPAMLIEVFRGFSQSLQASAGIVP
jgi:hypothetical protein